MTKDAWDIVNTVAQAISALGTLAAVIVALYLANHQNSVRLKVRVTIGGIITQGVPGSQRGPFMIIEIANDGFRDIRVVGIGWRIGWVRHHHFFQTLPMNDVSAILPKKLEPSDSISFFHPWQDYLNNSVSLRESFGSYRWLRRLNARSMKLVVRLSTGESIMLNPRGDVPQRLADETLPSTTGGFVTRATTSG